MQASRRFGPAAWAARVPIGFAPSGFPVSASRRVAAVMAFGICGHAGVESIAQAPLHTAVPQAWPAAQAHWKL